jgi:hypothetical protein
LPFCGRRLPRIPHAWTAGQTGTRGCDNPIVAGQPTLNAFFMSIRLVAADVLRLIHAAG